MPVSRPYLRDGIDVYVRGNDEIHFVFLATRKRLISKAQPYLIQSLGWLDGQRTACELAERMCADHGDRAREHFIGFLDYLEEKGIVVELGWLSRTGLDADTISTQERQLAFLLDILGTPERVADVQRRMSTARLVCFGVGAVGSWLIRQLLGLGFRRFVIVDHDAVDPADVSRHGFFEAAQSLTGEKKATLAAQRIGDQFSGVELKVLTSPLTTETRLDEVITTGTDLVINSADEPYIGYTSVLLSRFCVPRRIPLLVTGGFDAHLGSVSEMIIPGVTPCADCYAAYFQKALQEWVPIEHPVANRREASGGLCSLSVFAAGAAAMEVLRLFTNEGDPRSGRGELLFDSYRLDAYTVERGKDCPTCSRL